MSLPDGNETERETYARGLETVLSCLRAALGTAREDEAPPDMTGLDWGPAAELAVLHDVVPLFAEGLAVLGAPVPLDVQMALTTFLEAQDAHHRSTLLQLEGLMDGLRARQVRGAVFKGHAIASRYYGAVGRRTYRDVDLLVAGPDLDAVVEVLEARGFRNVYPASPRQRRWLTRYWGQLNFFHPEAEVAVEPHIRFHDLTVRFGIDYHAVLSRTEPMELDGVMVPVLEAGDELTAAIVHGSKDGWKQLKGLCDVVLIARELDSRRWNDLRRSWRSFGMGRAAEGSLILGSDLLGAPAVPQASSPGLRLAGLWEAGLRSPRPGGRPPVYPDIHDGRAAGLRGALVRGLFPREETFQVARLPDALFPLYFAVHFPLDGILSPALRGLRSLGQRGRRGTKEDG